MIIAVYNSKADSLAVTYGTLWQYDYGQVLRIQGLPLPAAVEIHFSLNETGGNAVTRIGITSDGVTDVAIPDSMLENDDTESSYYLYAFVYVTDDDSGETVYKLAMRVKARPKPEASDETDEDIYAAAVALINAAAESASAAEQSAAEASASADTAAGYAYNAGKSAAAASESATAAATSESGAKASETNAAASEKNAAASAQKAADSAASIGEDAAASAANAQAAAASAQAAAEAAEKAAAAASDFVFVLNDDGTVSLVYYYVEFAIITQPSDYEGEAGGTAVFTVEAEGNGLTYQWQYLNVGGTTWNNSTQTGYDTDTLSVPITEARDGQQYRCIVTDENGDTITSDTATLTVI